MLIFWRIRYLDRAARQFNDRDLFLDTSTLPPAQRGAVELLVESEDTHNERELLKFRTLFREESATDWSDERISAAGEFKGISLLDYFEDENGNELTHAEMGPILTGSPTAVLVPSGAKQHNIDYMLSENRPVPVAEVALSDDEVRLFGYFVRDLHELQDSALMKDGPGKVSRGGNLPPLTNDDYHFETAVSDDEIRSFITIFRRLYMAIEPANFLKSVALFDKILDDHPLGKLATGMAGEYEKRLKSVPDFCQRRTDTSVTFTTKRLIDVFLYTQYAHQPDERRQRQFKECLQQVGGQSNFLTWQFLTEVWCCALEIGNAGRIIAQWFSRYCDHHCVAPDVLNSLRTEISGLGSAEKKEVREARLFQEKVEELAMELWREAGEPEGGPVQFRLLAQEQLKGTLEGEE
ncbi:MAG: DUF2934 domain-containing protein [Planctomycetaceae bacterium]|nr:DUF2934 domain-containing protein [Planctomycetaceae bacterium]